MSRVWGIRAWGFASEERKGFRVQDLGNGVQGLGFGI